MAASLVALAGRSLHLAPAVTARVLHGRAAFCSTVFCAGRRTKRMIVQIGSWKSTTSPERRVLVGGDTPQRARAFRRDWPDFSFPGQGTDAHASRSMPYFLIFDRSVSRWMPSRRAAWVLLQRVCWS